jgi:DNA-directed RNA polymerase III subunit RPC1
MSDCAGHFGYVQLELPVFHAGYFKHTLGILQCICKRCSHVLLPIDDRKSYLNKFSSAKTDAFTKALLAKKIMEICKKTSRCPFCGYSNGVVKKLTSAGAFMKIIHEVHRAKNAEDQQEMYRMRMEEICRSNPELRAQQQSIPHTVRAPSCHTDRFLLSLSLCLSLSCVGRSS